MDYQSLIDEQVMFFAGDMNGTERCANITIQDDMLVECEEDFNITLTIQGEKSNLVLGNSITIDNNGKLPYMTYSGTSKQKSCHLSFNEKLSFLWRLKMNYCYREGVKKSLIVAPFLKE